MPRNTQADDPSSGEVPQALQFAPGICNISVIRHGNRLLMVSLCFLKADAVTANAFGASDDRKIFLFFSDSLGLAVPDASRFK